MAIGTPQRQTAFELIRYERKGSLALLTLDRPGKLNAINAAMVGELNHALDRAEADEEVRAIVMAGAGRAFSAGFDLDMGEGEASGAPDAQAVRQALQEDFRLIMRFWDCPKPTVAAVHGYCLGSAMELAMACDITVASEDCLFGAPEVRFGSGIVAMILPWLVGPKIAKELLLTGDDRVAAERALRIGVVNRIVPPGQLLDEALAFAERIAANDQLAVRLTKLAINRSLEAGGMREALLQALELDVAIETTATPESREFNAVLKREGAKAAVAWRNARTGKPVPGKTP